MLVLNFSPPLLLTDLLLIIRRDLVVFRIDSSSLESLIIFQASERVKLRCSALVLVAFGLGPLLQSSKLFYNSIQWAGGAYLIYLGYAAIAASRVDAQGMQKTEGSKPSFFTSLKNGFWVGVLNPKSIVFFAAILPQFVDQEKNNVTAQLLLLGAIFATIALISDGSYGLLAGTVRSWLAGDVKRLIFMRRFGGVVMIGLGLFTIFSAIIIG